MPIEDPSDGLGYFQNLGLGHEIFDLDCDGRVRTQPSAGINGKTPGSGPEMCKKTQVGHRRKGTILRTAGKDYLVLPRQIVRAVELQQVLGNRDRVGRHVELLLRADPGSRAHGHVANRIAAASSRRKPYFQETFEHVGSIFDCEIVNLDVLPGGDMNDAAAVPLAQFCDPLQLVRPNKTGADAYPHHIPTLGSVLVDALGPRKNTAGLGRGRRAGPLKHLLQNLARNLQP